MFSTHHDLTRLENRLIDETNVNSMQVLEEQIKGHQRPIIELKRTQNSLLNISTLPPEILGDIFCRCAIPEGFEERTYTFLLVCHHWFEVASCTPELWGFWGNNLRDWEEHHLRYPEIPLDLILLDGSRFTGGTLDRAVHDSLRDRASRDSIWRVHLRANDWTLLSSILFPLTANREVRYNCVESFILRNGDDTPVNVSRFFAYNRFRKLQHLELTNCTISSWNYLTLQTTALTTLVLHLSWHSPIPTTPQLFSILASNPALRKVALTGCSVPNDGDEDPSPQLPLHRLEELKLAGRSHDISRLLLRLGHPELMHDLDLALDHCAVEDISNVIGPYLRDYLRHRGWSQNKLGLHISSKNRIIRLHIGDIGGLPPFTPVSERMVPFVTITINPVQTPLGDTRERILLGLFAHTPQEEIVYLRTYGKPTAMENIYPRLPKLKVLYAQEAPLAAVLPSEGGDNWVPFLRHVFLERVIAHGNDWTPLMTFLSRRASPGKWLDSLEIVNPSHMYPEEAEDIGNAVRDFRTRRISPYSTFPRR